MYSFYRQLGYEITLYPTLLNGRPDKPDFLVRHAGTAAYVECKAVIERSRTALEASILHATNTASHPDFLLELDVEQEGSQQPSAVRIRESIEHWLQELNADGEIAAQEAGGPPKALRFQVGAAKEVPLHVD